MSAWRGEQEQGDGARGDQKFRLEKGINEAESAGEVGEVAGYVVEYNQRTRVTSHPPVRHPQEAMEHRFEAEAERTDA